MTDGQLAEIKKRAKWPVVFGPTPTADRDAMLAEVCRLRADEDVMRRLFADACIDHDTLRLAREEGRLEALRWAMKDREPDPSEGQWRWCLDGMAPPGRDDLPAPVFSVLCDGSREYDHTNEIVVMRYYASREEAVADLDQALRRLVREWPAEKETP